MEDGQNLGCIAAEFGSDHSSHLRNQLKDYYLVQIKTKETGLDLKCFKCRNQRLITITFNMTIPVVKFQDW